MSTWRSNQAELIDRVREKTTSFGCRRQVQADVICCATWDVPTDHLFGMAGRR
jgi:hypothetical protein